MCCCLRQIGSSFSVIFSKRWDDICASRFSSVVLKISLISFVRCFMKGSFVFMSDSLIVWIASSRMVAMAVSMVDLGIDRFGSRVDPC